MSMVQTKIPALHHITRLSLRNRQTTQDVIAPSMMPIRMVRDLMLAMPLCTANTLALK